MMVRERMELAEEDGGANTGNTDELVGGRINMIIISVEETV